MYIVEEKMWYVINIESIGEGVCVQLIKKEVFKVVNLIYYRVCKYFLIDCKIVYYKVCKSNRIMIQVVYRFWLMFM